MESDDDLNDLVGGKATLDPDTQTITDNDRVAAIAAASTSKQALHVGQQSPHTPSRAKISSLASNGCSPAVAQPCSQPSPMPASQHSSYQWTPPRAAQPTYTASATHQLPISQPSTSSSLRRSRSRSPKSPPLHGSPLPLDLFGCLLGGAAILPCSSAIPSTRRHTASSHL